MGRDNTEANITTINNCYNIGKVSTEVVEAYDNLISVGGLIGYIKGQSIIYQSYNTGEVINGLRTGGVLGFLRAGGRVIINESYNTGNVSSLSNDKSESEYRTTVGGIIGYNHNSEAIILNSYNNGQVKSIKQAAGIVGLINNESTSKIINSYNAGDVTSSGTYKVAGIALVYFDDNRANHLYLNNIYNIGTIVSNNDTYGITYLLDGSTFDISNTYYLDNISGSNNTNINLTRMSNSEMKSNNFVNTLNSNISNINLSEIDEILSGYQLLNWKLGENGYPVLK